MVHALAGRRFDGADTARRAHTGIRVLPVPLSRPNVAPRADDGHVRPADRRDGRGDPGRGTRLDRPHRLGGADRPRDLQPRRGGARRRRDVGAPAPRHGGRGRHARRIAGRCVPARHAGPAPSGDPGRGVDRVRVHVHLVRRDPHRRRTGHAHDRGRGVAQRDTTRSPRKRRGPRARPAGDPRRRGDLGDPTPADGQPGDRARRRGPPRSPPHRPPAQIRRHRCRRHRRTA